MNKESITHVLPAILPTSYADLEQKLEMVSDAVVWVQIDAVDGVFAPNKTWPYTNDSSNMFAKVIKQEQGLPSWEEVNFEVDLIVSDPMFEADKWIAAGALRLVVHVASLDIEQFKILSKNIKDKGVGLILGVSIKDSVDTIKEYASVVEDVVGTPADGIQCMGIRNIGFQHQDFDSSVLEKIKELKKVLPHIDISVDGGVGLSNAKALRDAGASRIICGSAIFEADNPHKVIEELEEIFSAI